MKNNFTKWVAAWGTATSIADRKECTYSRNLTLCYPVYIPFNAGKIRLHFSNFTGTEPVVLEKVFADHNQLTLNGSEKITIPAGQEITTDEIEFNTSRGQTVNISFYIKDFAQMNAGTLVTGPLSGGTYAYGDFAGKDEIPDDLCNKTNWYWFLNTVDVFTEENNYALCCYGDSITAQDWPDFLVKELETRNIENVSVIRRAVCGTRILRQYDCITYQAYGLKGAVRFPVELNIAGCQKVIIQHGINDIIHPVGVEVNKFRPMSDMPDVKDLIKGVQEIYMPYCREHNFKVYSGTLLPIYGWRTYAEFREEVRSAYNDWLRTSSDFDGCIDFDKAVRDEKSPERFAQGFDSGDHLHPSKDAYRVMAKAAADYLF